MAALKPLGHRWAGDSGAEVVEFALVLPLLLLIVLGIIDFGLLFQRYQVVTNAAREGARVAVLPDYSDADVVTRVNQYLAVGGLTDPAAPPPTVNSVPVAVGGHCITVRRVTVQYPHEYAFVSGIASFFGGGFASGMLEATSEMRSELGAGGCGP